MKFSIQEEGKDKQIFFTFKEASEKTGILSKRIAQTLRSGRNKYFRRSDKKTFWIQNEETTPFIQIDGEDFFTADEIQERFGVSRTLFFNQLAKKKTHFLDSQEKSHEVTWKSDDLEKFLSFMRSLERPPEKFFHKSLGKRGFQRIISNAKVEAKQTLEEFLD